MTRQKVEFDQLSAERFRFANGHMPRGYGWWSFQLHRSFSGASTEFHTTGNYTDAKKEAIREARSLGCDTVTVNT